MRSLRRQLPAEADPSKFVAATRRYTIASYEPTRLARILCARPVIGSLIATAVANPNQFHQGYLSGGIARVGLRGLALPARREVRGLRHNLPQLHQRGRSRRDDLLLDDDSTGLSLAVEVVLDDELPQPAISTTPHPAAQTRTRTPLPRSGTLVQE